MESFSFATVATDISSRMLPFWSAAWESYLMVSVAEVFDKTFFVVLVLSLRYDKWSVWLGGSLALIAHTLLAAVGGAMINMGLKLLYIDFLAAAVYFLFGVFYFYEYLECDENLEVADRANEIEDIEGSLGDAYSFLKHFGLASAEAKPRQPPQLQGPDGDGSANENTQLVTTQPKKHHNLAIFWVAFATTFVAEIGDRTQVTMFAQHAAQPLWAVVIGSSLAFLQLNTVACLVGLIVQKQGLKEKTVILVAAISFIVFAALTLWDAKSAYYAEQMYAVTPPLLVTDMVAGTNTAL